MDNELFVADIAVMNGEVIKKSLGIVEKGKCGSECPCGVHICSGIEEDN
jgi:hypothetical protein